MYVFREYEKEIYTVSIEVKKTPAYVFNPIMQLSEWWPEEFAGEELRTISICEVLKNVEPMPPNKFFVVVIFVLFWVTSRSQETKNSTAFYRSVPEVEVVTNNSVQDKIGLYEWRVGSYEVEFIKLDSTMHFQKRAQYCVGGELRDSGVWFVYKTGRIGLKGQKGLKTFDLVKFSHFYFCILPDQRVNFVADFAKLKLDYPGSELLGSRLMHDFYFHDLKNPEPKYY